MEFPFGTTVTRQRAGRTLDVYSQEATDLDWSAPEEVQFEGCAVWQESSLEPDPIDQRRMQVVTMTKVTLPYDADVEPLDRFIVLGHTYEVQGELERYKHPITGWAPGSIATGKRIDG
jgi:hypothetical protein